MVEILLADDDAALRDLVRRALASEGYAVAAVEDGAEALKLLEARAGAFSVLVTDLDMPGLDGISLAKQARAHNAGIAVVVMSAFADQLERAAGVGGARVTTLTKPFSLEDLKRLVRALV